LIPHTNNSGATTLRFNPPKLAPKLPRVLGASPNFKYSPNKNAFGSVPHAPVKAKKR